LQPWRRKKKKKCLRKCTRGTRQRRWEIPEKDKLRGAKGKEKGSDKKKAAKTLEMWLEYQEGNRKRKEKPRGGQKKKTAKKK